MIAGRYLIDRGNVVYEDYSRIGGNNVDWLVELADNPGTFKEYKHLAQVAKSTISCRLAAGSPLLMVLTKGKVVRKIPLYPKKGADGANEIAVDIYNLMSEDLIDPAPFQHVPVKTLEHFNYFYPLANGATSLQGTCPLPVGKNVPLSAPPLGGKPYCSFAEFVSFQ